MIPGLVEVAHDESQTLRASDAQTIHQWVRYMLDPPSTSAGSSGAYQARFKSWLDSGSKSTTPAGASPSQGAVSTLVLPPLRLLHAELGRVVSHEEAALRRGDNGPDSGDEGSGTAGVGSPDVDVEDLAAFLSRADPPKPETAVPTQAPRAEPERPPAEFYAASAASLAGSFAAASRAHAAEGHGADGRRLEAALRDTATAYMHAHGGHSDEPAGDGLQDLIHRLQQSPAVGAARRALEASAAEALREATAVRGALADDAPSGSAALTDAQREWQRAQSRAAAVVERCDVSCAALPSHAGGIIAVLQGVVDVLRTACDGSFALPASPPSETALWRELTAARQQCARAAQAVEARAEDAAARGRIASRALAAAVADHEQSAIPAAQRKVTAWRSYVMELEVIKRATVLHAMAVDAFVEAASAQTPRTPLWSPGRNAPKPPPRLPPSYDPPLPRHPNASDTNNGRLMRTSSWQKRRRVDAAALLHDAPVLLNRAELQRQQEAAAQLPDADEGRDVLRLRPAEDLFAEVGHLRTLLRRALRDRERLRSGRDELLTASQEHAKVRKEAKDTKGLKGGPSDSEDGSGVFLAGDASPARRRLLNIIQRCGATPMDDNSDDDGF